MAKRRRDAVALDDALPADVVLVIAGALDPFSVYRMRCLSSSLKQRIDQLLRHQRAALRVWFYCRKCGLRDWFHSCHRPQRYDPCARGLHVKELVVDECIERKTYTKRVVAVDYALPQFRLCGDEVQFLKPFPPNWGHGATVVCTRYQWRARDQRLYFSNPYAEDDEDWTLASGVHQVEMVWLPVLPAGK